jgi:hypothetical protein
MSDNLETERDNLETERDNLQTEGNNQRNDNNYSRNLFIGSNIFSFIAGCFVHYFMEDALIH